MVATPFGVIDAFYYPLAGVQVLSMLIAGGDDHSFPSRTPVPLAVNPIAGQLGVSRMHLKRLLRHAEATQLLCAHPGEPTPYRKKPTRSCASSTPPS